MELFGNIVRIVLETVLTVFLAELTAGAVHWFEDAYVREDTPLIGRLLGRPNVIHHHYPRHMTRNTWWQSSYDLVIIAASLIVTFGFGGLLTWQVWLFAILSANANQMHKWTHRTRKENGPVIAWLQDIRILQTPKHHLIHHKDPKNSHYCTMTNCLNPVLDAIRFWAALEWVLARTAGLERQPDSSPRCRAHARLAEAIGTAPPHSTVLHARCLCRLRRAHCLPPPDAGIAPRPHRSRFLNSAADPSARKIPSLHAYGHRQALGPLATPPTRSQPCVLFNAV